MPTFQYKALQSDGTLTEGELDAGGRLEAFRQMESRGLRLVRLDERNGSTRTKQGPPKGASKSTVKESASEKSNSASLPLKLSFGNPNKVSARMLENFTRLLSSLLAAGVPLSRALVILCREASAPAASAKWKEVHDLVIDGMPLADISEQSPKYERSSRKAETDSADGYGGRRGRTRAVDLDHLPPRQDRLIDPRL